MAKSLKMVFPFFLKTTFHTNPNVKAVFFGGELQRAWQSSASHPCASPFVEPQEQLLWFLLLLSVVNWLKWLIAAPHQCHSQRERMGWGDTGHNGKQWIKHNITPLYSISPRAGHSVTPWQSFCPYQGFPFICVKLSTGSKQLVSCLRLKRTFPGDQWDMTVTVSTAGPQI